MTPPAHPDARIVIIDDEPANVLLVERALSANGYHDLRSYNDPREAVARFALDAPDLVLVDLNMPHLDGFELMAELESRVGDGGFVPFLVLTADATPDSLRKSFERGARDFMTKPLKIDELLLRVASLLDTRHRHRRVEARADLMNAQQVLATAVDQVARIEPSPEVAAPARVGSTRPTTAAKAPARRWGFGGGS